MKKVKTFLALLLVAALMLMLFAACASSSESGNSNSASEPNSSNAGTGTENSAPVDDDETVTVVFNMFDMNGTADDHGAAVKEAVVNYVLEKLNIDLQLNIVSLGNWQTHTLMAITSGERIDLMSLFGGTAIYDSYPQGMVKEISEYLQTYASDALEICSDYVNTYTFDGGIYGLPTMRNFAKNGYLLFNKPLLDELDLTEQAKAIDSWSDYEAVMEVILQKKGADGIYPTRGATGDWMTSSYYCTGDSFDTFISSDSAGSTSTVIIDDKVCLFQETDGYVYMAKKMAEWMDAGYCWPESLITEEFPGETVKQGIVASYFGGSEHGVEVQMSNIWGFECLAVLAAKGMIKTSQPQFVGIGVPITAEEPEAACRLINLLYTDSYVMNLLVWGVEGVDYELVNGEVTYGDGAHYMGSDFLVGNNLLLTGLAGKGADFYEKVQEINESAEKSPYLGFALDTTGLESYTAAISAVTDQYSQTMNGGGYTEESYQEFISKMYAAGAEEYMAKVQEQLDAWLAAK